MTIDEVIAEERDNAEFFRCNDHSTSAEYHNKIAEWLEELKAYRENSNGYNKEDIELNRNAMYNKAIDDFVEAILQRLTYAIYQNDVQSITNLINEVAEELKGE